MFPGKNWINLVSKDSQTRVYTFASTRQPIVIVENTMGVMFKAKHSLCFWNQVQRQFGLDTRQISPNISVTTGILIHQHTSDVIPQAFGHSGHLPDVVCYLCAQE